MALTTNFLWPLAWLGLLGLPGCHPRSGRALVLERELLSADFEKLAGWLPPPPAGLTTEKAHSGRYAIRVDPEHPYSITYRAPLGRLSPHHRPRRVTLSAWVWVPGPEGDARLVAAVYAASDPDHPFFSKNVFLTDSGPFKAWKQVSRSLDLPDNIDSNSQLEIYLWNGGSSVPVYADDLQLTELW